MSTSLANPSPIEDSHTIALFDAVDAGDIAGMQQALKNGADIHARKGSGLIPCAHVAINSKGGNRYETLKFVLDNGVDPNASNRRGFTAIHSLANNPDVDLINLMLDYGADPNTYTLSGVTPPHNETPLHEAARKNRMTAVEPLLKAGADPLLLDKDDKTVLQRIPIDWAGPREMVKPYADLPRLDMAEGFSKADLMRKDANGLCPLDNPVTWRHWPQVEEALAKNDEAVTKADLQQIGWQDRSYLSRAADARQLGAVVAHLNAHDETLSVAEVKACDETMAESLNGSYVPKQLFTFDNLAEQGPSGYRDNLAELSDEGRENLSGKHALASKLRNHHAQEVSITR